MSFLFWPVNDTYGHEAGDKVLIETSRRLKSCLGDDDDVARFGGDEFVVYLHGINSEVHVNSVIEKISKLIEVPHALQGDVHVRIGASIGWACSPDDGNDVETLLQVADARMFDNKKLHHLQ